MSALTLSRVGVISSSHVGTPPPTVDPDLAYLLSCVASDHAISETPGDVNVRPYMAHYACIGLSRAYTITSDASILTKCWDWLTWYADHMDGTTGYVNDYSGPSGARVDSGAADSTDAYAGMFLAALYITFDASGNDTTTLANYTTAIGLAVTAITSTQQPFGLTWALASYTNAYLEDNVETLYGLSAAINMLGYLGEDGTAASDAFDLLAHGFGNLYNEETGVFDWAIDASHVFTRNDWTDENSQRQQIWALGWGALPPYAGEASALLDAYVAALPGWDTQDTSYEPMATWAYLRINSDPTVAAGYADTLRAVAATNSRAYPWTCQTSGLIYVGKYGFPTVLAGAPSPNFPNQANMIDFAGYDPAFYVDADSDGRADALSNYGSPTMTLIADPDGPTGAHIQQMASPACVFLDDFQRADGAIGNGWTALYDTAVISSHTVVATSSYATYAQDMGLTDLEIEGLFTLSGPSSTISCYMIARAVDADNNIKVGINGFGYSVISTVGGTPTFLATNQGAALGTSGTVKIGLKLNGSTASIYRDGVHQGDYTIPDGASTGTLAGFQVDGAGVGLTNWSAFPLSGGGEDMRWSPISTFVEENAFYVFSFERWVTALKAGGDVVIKMELLDSSGALVNPGAYTYDTHNTVDTDWVRWHLGVFTPPGTTQIRCIIGIDTGGTVQVRQPKLEKAGAGPTPFVYPDPPPVVYGTADFSGSGDLPSPWYYNSNPHLQASGGVGVVPGGSGIATALIDLPADDFTMTWDWVFNSGAGLQIQFRTQPGGGTTGSSDPDWYQVGVDPAGTTGAVFNHFFSGTYSNDDYDTGFGFVTGATVIPCTLSVSGSTVTFSTPYGGGFGHSSQVTSYPPVSGGRTIQVVMQGDSTIDNIVIQSY